MKYYITKYALTKGIKIIEDTTATPVYNYNDGSIKYGMTIYHKGEWFDTHEKAIMNAYDRRDKKIKALFKNIEKLEQMVF